MQTVKKNKIFLKRLIGKELHDNTSCGTGGRFDWFDVDVCEAGCGCDSGCAGGETSVLKRERTNWGKNDY